MDFFLKVRVAVEECLRLHDAVLLEVGHFNEPVLEGQIVLLRLQFLPHISFNKLPFEGIGVEEAEDLVLHLVANF